MSDAYPVMSVGNGKVRRAHTVIAEKAFGGKLPSGVVVHHVDCCGTNNKNNNLVICQSQAYHKLLHMRTTALDACGNANWLKCRHCKKYDAPGKLVSIKIAGSHVPRTYHAECNREYQRQYAAR